MLLAEHLRHDARIGHRLRFANDLREHDFATTALGTQADFTGLFFGFPVFCLLRVHLQGAGLVPYILHFINCGAFSNRPARAFIAAHHKCPRLLPAHFDHEVARGAKPLCDGCVGLRGVRFDGRADGGAARCAIFRHRARISGCSVCASLMLSRVNDDAMLNRYECDNFFEGGRGCSAQHFALEPIEIQSEFVSPHRPTDRFFKCLVKHRERHAQARLDSWNLARS
ncbi:hypothetical protein [Paraburkholderia sp. WSM4174]|uniref:hypothetical protein n=1 Tax=Paraburkholderia sp. WSM4174 TaxID=2991071 RepID=UPI00039FD4F8